MPIDPALKQALLSCEQAFSQQLDHQKPLILRLDGRAFSHWQRGLQAPFDDNLATLMQRTTAHLVKETHAQCGYTCNDEISLILLNTQPDQNYAFGGKVHKWNALTAAEASVYFQIEKQTLPLPDVHKRTPVLFDCRVFQVSDLETASQYLLWREEAAIRNSVATLARHHLKTISLHNKNTPELLQLLSDQGIDWNTLAAHHQRGSVFRRVSLEVPFTPQERLNLPDKHHAKRNPNATYTRRKIVHLDLPPLHTLEDPKNVLF